MQLFALLTLDFSSTPVLKTLISLHIVTRWLVLQKAPHHTYYVLWAVVSTQFQVLFHSPPGVLFTFPSRYYFSIGHQVVFSLGWWSTLLPTRFLVSRGTLGKSLSISVLNYVAFTLFGLDFHLYSSNLLSQLWTPSTPKFPWVWALPLSLAAT